MEDFSEPYEYLEKMVNHDNRWIRRGVCVAVHFYAKRRHSAEVRKLLKLLVPALDERNRDLVKGV